MRPYTLIPVVVVSFVVGLALGAALWKTQAAEAPSNADATIERNEETIASLRSIAEESKKKASVAEAAAKKAEKALEEARRSRPELAAAEAGGEALLAPGPQETAAAPEIDQTPRFFADRYDGVLRRMDWRVIGNNMSEMTPLVAKLARSLLADEPVSAEGVGRIQELNGPLVTAALTLDKQSDLPGTGANGKFANPIFMVNAMAATLAAANMPLTETQERTLVSAAERWEGEFERRRARFDENTIGLRKLYEEAEVKDGFFRDAFDALSPEQVLLLSPEETRGRIRLDVFSSGLLYVASVKPAPFENRDQIVAQFLSEATSDLKLDSQEQETTKSVISAWVDHLPRELLEWETDRLDHMGMVHTKRVTGWARETVKLLSDLATSITFDQTRRKSVRDLYGVLVPIRK